MKICLLLTFLVHVKAFNNLPEFRCRPESYWDWSYHGGLNFPFYWDVDYPKCGGSQQSPIDIDVSKVVFDEDLEKLHFVNYDIPLAQAQVLNTGKMLKIIPRDDVRRIALVACSKFTLQDIELHFGGPMRPAPEHKFGSLWYNIEIHFNHKNTKNQTAVVALFVEMKWHDNTAFWPLLEVLPEVKYKDDSATIASPLNLSQLIPEHPASYYRYIGSLTHPPCDEGVIWSLLVKPTFLHFEEIALFGNLSSVKKENEIYNCLLGWNYRPLQPLNGRVVFRSW